MRAGALRHQVTLEQPGAAVPDGEGGYTETWTALTPSPVWAAIQPASARDLERVFAGASQATASHLVTLRYHAGVTTATRLTFGTRVFAITGVQNLDERNKELVLACEEVVS